MTALRNFLCWVFALTALVCVPVTLPYLQRIYRHSSRHLLPDLIVLSMFAIFITVFGAAWWTTWRRKRSGRFWGIAASLINILLALPIIILTRSVNDIVAVLAVGVVGLVAFWRRYEQPSSAAAAHQNVRIPGDGTSDFFDRAVQILICAISFGAYFWWLEWLEASDIPVRIVGGERIVMVFLVLLIITALHELGHTLTGVALGMKLWAFFVGPFQWHIYDGKWEFQFKPAAILSLGGATNVVPATTDFPRWRQLTMLSGGIVLNLLTGVTALLIAFTARVDSAAQAGGFTAFFGAWSLLLGAANLLPFRTANMYSDGAQIYHLLSVGPLGDLYRVRLNIASSLVTPLRPRDYDIDAVMRLWGNIMRGQQALLLRLYAYFYFLDVARLPAAGEALREAGSIYDQSASHISAELCNVFIFGNAYVLRDAAAARLWWTRMESKKPTRFNVDYWRARAALRWIEGDLQEANEAWDKSNALAQKLPKAGAYEFDRYCCFLLRRALDETSAAKVVPILADTL